MHGTSHECGLRACIVTPATKTTRIHGSTFLEICKILTSPYTNSKRKPRTRAPAAPSEYAAVRQPALCRSLGFRCSRFGFGARGWGFYAFGFPSACISQRQSKLDTYSFGQIASARPRPHTNTGASDLWEVVVAIRNQE